MQLLAFIFSQQQMRIESGGSGSGPGVPIARGFLLSCPVDRDHHRHTVHAPGGQLPWDSYPGRHIVSFERPFLLFCSGYGGLRQFYDGGYLCPGRCRGKLFAIRYGIPAPVVRILGGEVFAAEDSFDSMGLGIAHNHIGLRRHLGHVRFDDHSCLVVLEGRGIGNSTAEILDVVRSEQPPLPWPQKRLNTLFSYFFLTFPWVF